MKINAGDNKKVFFFYLLLVDFVIAVQIAAVSFFPKKIISPGNDWTDGNFILTFSLSFLVFLIFSGVFKNAQEIKKIIQPGLIFMILGSLINLFLNDSAFTLGRSICGLGAGMVMAGQIGIIWHEDFNSLKKFSFLILVSFFLGLILGPYLIKFLSGPALSELKTSFVFGAIFPFLAIFGLSQKLENFFIWLIKTLLKEKKRLGILGIGYLTNETIDFIFNFIIYPFVIWKLGILGGGAVMTILSFLICYIIMIFYDWSKKDWLGIETIKQVKEYQGKSLIGRFTSWMLKKGDLAVFLFLSIQFDPFITTAYLRHGAHNYSGMKKRDWKNFIASLLVGNIYWTLVAFAGVSLIEYIGKRLF